MEIVERTERHLSRGLTAQFGDAVYVLHAFQKKSKRGIATPKQEIDLIRGGWPRRGGTTGKGRPEMAKTKKKSSAAAAMCLPISGCPIRSRSC